MPFTVVQCDGDIVPWQQHWGGPAEWVGCRGFWRRSFQLGTGIHIDWYRISRWTWVEVLEGESDPESA